MVTTTSREHADRSFFVANGIVSAIALSVIAFILMREGQAVDSEQLAFVPAMNAVFNSLAASCLVLGYLAIRRGARVAHQRFMIGAFALSSLFLVGYLAYHFVHGDTKFTGTGPIRGVYFFILITHIVLSIGVVPMALTSFYFAFRRAFDRHRRLNRIFLPIWLYVSVTGVLIFLIQRLGAQP